MSHFLTIFKITITLEVNMVTRQMTPFFHLLFWLYPLVYIVIQDLQNSLFKLGFTPCKAEQSLAAMEFQEIVKRLKYTGNLFRKNLQLKDVC